MMYKEELLTAQAPSCGRMNEFGLDRTSLMSRIASYAAETPARPAIVDGEITLSFGELDAWANQLANHLGELGVSMGSTVALLFDRSADFIVAALAVMKAGGAYVPMDTATPADRAAFIIADSGANVLLTHRGKSQGIPARSAHVVELDGQVKHCIANRPAIAPGIEFSSDDLAYLIYTSGSTGRPKGVEITHANLNSLIDWHQSAFNVTPADRASHVAGLGFDAAGWEIWPHLTAGAAVFIADEPTRRSPMELLQWVVDRQITICFSPTIVAEQMLAAEWPKSTALRTFLIGGDTLHRRPSADLPFVVVNNYGPSECTVVATSGRVSSEGDYQPSIGRSIGNTFALILDENLQAVTEGEPGELCLAGSHVGRGYRNDPALTARQFVSYKPADGGPAMRIYRTGDRAKFLNNGEIAFLGRLDDQVKIRGYRIEPGEIVTWIDQLPGVETSAVIADRTGAELIAYIVAKPQFKLTVDSLRKHLAAKVPDYMIPARFVSMTALPMTANGKLDRAALPEPSAENVLPSVAHASPIVEQTKEHIDTRIGVMVAQLLGQPAVKATDNFFMLGGHSMLGVQLVARIRDAFGVKLTLRQLFTAPTVAALSAEVKRLTPAAAIVSQAE